MARNHGAKNISYFVYYIARFFRAHLSIS